MTTGSTIKNPQVICKIIFHGDCCDRNIIGIKNSVSLTVIVTCTTVTVGFIFQFVTIAFNMTWTTTISAISAITRIFLKIVVISAILTVILARF
jgi:hypothetical protein